MCLAVPAQVVEKTGEDAVVDLQGNRLRISTALTPEVGIGDWVLVHAGFAITQLDEADARETWDYLRQALGAGLSEAGGEPAEPGAGAIREGEPPGEPRLGRSLALPDVALPDVALPDVALPDVALPDVALPDAAEGS